jgi:hypothetical protein
MSENDTAFAVLSELTSPTPQPWLLERREFGTTGYGCANDLACSQVGECVGSMVLRLSMEVATQGSSWSTVCEVYSVGCLRALIGHAVLDRGGGAGCLSRPTCDLKRASVCIWQGEQGYMLRVGQPQSSVSVFPWRDQLDTIFPRLPADSGPTKVTSLGQGRSP